jgi:hypothetical protein
MTVQKILAHKIKASARIHRGELVCRAFPPQSPLRRPRIVTAKGTGLSAMNETKATTAETASNNKHAAGHTALQQSYGEIGISAVAAAVLYQGAAKNPAYAPAPTKSSPGNSKAIA